MRRARRRRLRAALPWAVAGGVLAVAGLAVWVVTGTSVFGVRDLRVLGTETLTVVQVRQAAGVPDGTPLARVDLATVRSQVAALPPVDRVTVRRDWPRTLVVEVVERAAAAVVPQDQRFAVVDDGGVVFRVLAERPAGVPLLRVAEPAPDDAETQAGLSVLAALTPQLREELVDVVVDGPAQIKLRLRGGRTVIWGDASQGETKARVASALLGRKGDTIDVSAPEVVTIG